jgi:tetratricopeptide (TPR) repeat protein
MMRSAPATACLLFPALLALVACSGPEARMSRYMERGQQYFAEQNYDKARIEISNALQIDPKNAPARVLAGQIAEKQGKPRDAVGSYQAAIDSDNGNVDARAALGRIYLMAGLPDKAKETIAPALEKAPGDARLLTVRGGLRAVQGDLEGAMADAQAAVKAAPGDEVALALLAAQYQRAGRVDDAIAAIQKGLEKQPDTIDLRVILADLQARAGHAKEAEQQLQIIADRNPTELGHWQRLARFQLFQKNPAGAEQTLRAAVKHNPGSIEAKNALVGLLANQQGVEAAQAQMLKFVQAEPKSTELKLALGQFYQASRNLKEAETVYREVIAAEGVQTKGLEARNRLAALLLQRPDVPAAEKLIGEVLTQNPRDNDALVLRAGVALSRNETAAAITDLRAVLRDQPDSQPLMRTLARAHLQDNDAVLAEEVLRNAVQVNPTDQQSRFELAGLLSDTGRVKLALPILEQLAKEATDNIAVREALFRVQTSQADWEGASKTAEEVKRLRPDLPTGYLLAGNLFEHDKKYPAAMAEYETALQKTQDPSVVLPVLVRTDLQQKQPQKAAARLSAQLEKTPDFALGHELLGEVRLVQGDQVAAIASFDRAIALNPKFWMPYRAKATALDTARKPELALAVLSQGFIASGATDLGLELARKQDLMGHHDEAIKTYESLHQRAPRSLPVANNLAMLLVSRRSDAVSFKQAEKLGELLAASSEAPYLDTRGWIKFRSGQIQEALPLLEQAAAKAPQSNEILYHLGMAQYRAGNSKAARQSLEAALTANQSFDGVVEARATLATLRSTG